MQCDVTNDAFDGHGDGYACCCVHVNQCTVQYKGKHSAVQLSMAEACCDLVCEQSQRTF